MLETLLKDGWNYHDEQSESLACELEATVGEGVAPALLISFLALSTHTIGEHLGDWPRALTLGKRALEGHTPTAETAKAWARLYVAAVLAKDLTGAAEIELVRLRVADDVLACLLEMRFMLANALVGAKRVAESAQIYRAALDSAGQIEGSPDLYRSVAVASNNLAWALFEVPQRTNAEAALMQSAADAGLAFWSRCGTWINEERALYLESLVAHATGHAQAALTFAETALTVIAAHGVRPLDTALLHLARAQSLGALGNVEGKTAALAEADTAASKLVPDVLKQQFAAERAKVAAL